MPDDAVLEILKAIQAELATVRADVGSVRIGLAGHTRLLNILLQDTREIRAATNDMATSRVTAGEIEAVHHDLTRVQQEVAELAAKVDALEHR